MNYNPGRHPSMSKVLGPQYGSLQAADFDKAEPETSSDHGPSATFEQPKSGSTKIRIGAKVAAERRAQAETVDEIQITASADGLDEYDIVGCDVSHRCLLYHLMLFDQPDTVRSVKSTDLVGDRWTAMIREFWEVDEYREAAFNEYVQYCRSNAVASPFHYQVWGSQVSGYRHVRFLVSGPGILAPQVRSGPELGEEWSAAIAEYWCWRKARTEQKDGFVHMVSGLRTGSGYG